MQNTHSALYSGYLLTNCPSAPSSPFNALLCDNRAKTLQTCSVVPVGRQDGKNRDFILIFQLLSPLLHSNRELIPAWHLSTFLLKVSLQPLQVPGAEDYGSLAEPQPCHTHASSGLRCLGLSIKGLPGQASTCSEHQLLKASSQRCKCWPPRAFLQAPMFW